MYNCEGSIKYSLSSIRTYYLKNSPIYIVDNFYSNPSEILNILQSNSPTVLHKTDKATKNTVEYDDLRHEIPCSFMNILSMSISNIHGQNPISKDLLYSNLWKSHVPIPYETHYYYPHRDVGYTCLIYLNDYGEEYPGTNIYEPNCDVEEYLTREQHIHPWASKDEWNLIYTIPAKYNRLVIFNGKKFWHGMSLFDSRWVNHQRMNQVMFFVE